MYLILSVLIDILPICKYLKKMHACKTFSNAVFLKKYGERKLLLKSTHLFTLL
jgi:hypothetical protein